MKTFSAACRAMNPRMLAVFLFWLCLFGVVGPAAAQQVGGLQSVNSLMQNVLDVLKGVSIAAVTIALIITGFKMAFRGESLADCAPVIVGGVVIGAAGEIASLLLTP